MGLGSIPLKKYSSTNENRFFRGIALRFKPLKNLEFCPLFSSKKIDARLDIDGVKSLGTNGLHRTVSELSTKDGASERMYGLRTEWNGISYQVGINYLNYFITPDILKSNYAWKLNDFKGNRNENFSIDYKFTLGRCYVFGESALSKNGGRAHLIGSNLISETNVQITLLLRSYDRDFHSIYGKGFGESSKTRNEKGVYLGFEYSPVRELKINAYYDYFKFPSRAYRLINGGDGSEYLINVHYALSDKLDIAFKYKSEVKPIDINIDSFISTVDISRKSYRLSLLHTINDRFKLNSRFEYIRYLQKYLSEDGMQIYLDLKYSSILKRLKCQSRIAYFNTDSYNTRIYSYENDVLYAFSFPTYYYKGMRVYINTSYKIVKALTIYIKAGLTYWKTHPNKQDFQCQLRIRI
jgi:hypothetical protein